MLEVLKEALHTAQSELALADIALMEATAHQQVAFASATRLASAVAALSGEPSAPIATPAPEEGATPDKSIHELTPEEFDAQRRRNQAQKRKEDEEWRAQNDPLYHMKCSGCGLKGTLSQTMMTAPSGAQVAMKVCTKCNNQIMG
jgi:hypothetical protein